MDAPKGKPFGASFYSLIPLSLSKRSVARRIYHPNGIQKRLTLSDKPFFLSFQLFLEDTLDFINHFVNFAAKASGVLNVRLWEG